MKKVAMLVGLVLAFTTALAGVASADTTLGSTAIPGGSATNGCEGAVIAQTASDPSTPYTVPTSPVGPLTTWQVNVNGATAGEPVTLVVLRSTGATTYAVVAADTQAIPTSPPGNIATFTVLSPIAVSGGEILGLYSPGETFVCYFHGGSTPAADELISLHPGGTPFAGQSLDLEDSSGPNYTLNLAATLKAPVPAKKKCKKHKKKRSADSAKKKKCKKKKKR
jgi:hypothetical protein